MRLVSALFFLLPCSPLLAQTPAPSDPLTTQRRLAAVLRQATTDYDRGDYASVISRLDALTGPSADDLSVLNLRAAALTKTGEYDRALRFFADILRAKPDYFPAAFNSAEVLFLRGDLEGSLEAFRRLRQRDPNNELLRFKVFLCLVALGRDAEAAKVAQAMHAAGLTPSWYYAQAVIARREGDQPKASEHLRAAQALYGTGGCRLYDESLQSAGL